MRRLCMCVCIVQTQKLRHLSTIFQFNIIKDLLKEL